MPASGIELIPPSFTLTLNIWYKHHHYKITLGNILEQDIRPVLLLCLGAFLRKKTLGRDTQLEDGEDIHSGHEISH